ncbi:MAG: hypothetical protein WC685_07585 [Methylobacter sp.]
MAIQPPHKTDATSSNGARVPPTPKRIRCKLDNLSDIKREMSTVYRQARSEIIDPVSAAKLVWILSSIGKVIEGSDLEKRLAALEELQK